MSAVIEFSAEAWELVDANEDQREALSRLLPNSLKLRVLRDFSLPEGWLYFIQESERFSQPNATIHGGISPEGDIHT